MGVWLRSSFPHLGTLVITSFPGVRRLREASHLRLPSRLKLACLPFPYLLSLDPLLSINDSCECLLVSEETHHYIPCWISTTTLKQKNPTSVATTHLAAEGVPSSHLLPSYKKKRKSLFVTIQSWLNVDKFSSRNASSFMR